MDSYITGIAIKSLREAKGLTQTELADQIGVSNKTVSKWETAKGFPDISLIEPLAKALGVSVLELISGDVVTNRNVSANMLRSKFYTCPICGNIVCAAGSTVISCCGLTLPAQDAEDADDLHNISIENVEDEHFIRVNHEMTKQHYISFLAFVTSDRVQLVKLYPEGNAETRFQLRGQGLLFLYCNKHGLMKQKITANSRFSLKNQNISLDFYHSR